MQKKPKKRYYIFVFSSQICKNETNVLYFFFILLFPAMNSDAKEHIHSAAEFFFFLIGFGYVFGYLLQSNELFVIEYEYFLAFADIPFLFSALVYFFLSLLLRAEKDFLLNRFSPSETKDFFWHESISLIVGILIFSGYFVVDLLG